MDKWKSRSIKMPDDLWFRAMVKAGQLKMETAEFVRMATEEKLKKEEDV